MHILLVSSVIESSSSAKLFKRLNDVTVHETTSLDCLHNKGKKLSLVFFDAALGLDDVTYQIQLYQQKNQAIKWLMIDVTNIQQSLQYLQLGASGVLSQPSEKTLQDCFQCVSKGQLYLEDDFIQIVALRQIKKTLLPFKQLL